MRMTTCWITIDRPSDAMKPLFGWSRVNWNNPRSKRKPRKPTRATDTRRAGTYPTPYPTNTHTPMPPSMRNSPWAKLMMPVNPNISVTPMPIRMMTLATERLLTSSWMKVSIASFPASRDCPRQILPYASRLAARRGPGDEKRIERMELTMDQTDLKRSSAFGITRIRPIPRRPRREGDRRLNRPDHQEGEFRAAVRPHI